MSNKRHLCSTSSWRSSGARSIFGETGAWSNSIPARRQVVPHTNRYLVLGLSFEGGIFNQQQTTFVPICPCGRERLMWPQN